MRYNLSSCWRRTVQVEQLTYFDPCSVFTAEPNYNSSASVTLYSRFFVESLSE